MRFLRKRSVPTTVMYATVLCSLPLVAQAQQNLQRPTIATNVHNHAVIAVSSTASSSAGSRKVTIRFSQGTNPSSVKAVVNGKNVSAQFQQELCPGAVCLSADLSSVDGVAAGKNVFYATAKNQDGTASSSRVHFTGGDGVAQPNSTNVLTSPRAGIAAQVGASNLPTNSTFLPPSVLFQTLANVFGGAPPNQPWFTLGSLQQILNGSCTSTYSVIVLDRRTLEQKTNAPESSPQCFNSSANLGPYLQSLAGNNDIVIVGTNAGQITDAGAYNVNDPDPNTAAFDTSAIGGTFYNCPGCTGAGSLSSDIPLTYLAIGVPGAAGGSAYEDYSKSGTPSANAFATGMFVEDATGNYNFVSSNNVEFIVSPGSTAATPSVTIMNAPSEQGMNVVYGPPANSVNGFWLLVLQRYDLASDPGCPQSGTNGSTVTIPNCGQFFPTGSNGGNIATVGAMAQALSNVNSGQVAILTTVGTAGWGSPATMASDNAIPNNTIPLAAALQSYGIPDKSILYTGTAGSSWTMVGTPGLGGPLNGHNLLSSSYFLQEGHTGYIHGTFARDNHGLYEPSHSEQQNSSSDTANLQLGLITSQQPQEWPEYSALPQASSVAGQVDAYKYLSWYLLNGWYLQGQATATGQSAGIAGPQQYDIHYFFTGSLNTLLDYHTFDPLDAVFPANVQADHRTVPCAGTSGSNPVTCTWEAPDGTILTFTNNDFAAVQIQMHNELVDLNNVLTYMVNGSTNMKDIVAAGNSNAALTLIQALTEVQANITQPPPPTARVTVSPWHIMNMIASDVSPLVSFATDGVVNPGDIALADKAIGFVGDLYNAAGGTGGGLSTVDNNTNKQIPRLDYKLDIAIGQLATTDLQGAILAGFDSTLDVITGDWGKLQALGGPPANNSPLFAPTQATQLQVIQMITKASQKSLYASLIPQIYQVQKWGMTGSAPTADMGYTKNGDTGSCTPFYDNPTTPWVAVPYPTYGGISYWEPWHSVLNPATWPYKYNSDPLYQDWYVIALPFSSGGGTTGATTRVMDGTLTNILFGNGSNSVNFIRDEFVAQQGPMDLPITGDGVTHQMSDYGFSTDGPNPNPKFSAGTNVIGLETGQICSVAEVGISKVGSGTPDPRTTTTVLNAPVSAVLGSDVILNAKAIVASSSAPAAGSMQFRDGNVVLTTLPLDGTGSANFTVKGLALGTHSIAAYFISNDGNLPSDSGQQSLTVYANSPDMQLVLSQPTLNVGYGTTSSPVSLKVLALSGMSGTVNYACSGLPVGMTCSFSPASSTLSDGGTATTSFTISGTPVVTTPASFLVGRGWMFILTTAPLLVLVCIPRRSRRALTNIVLPLLVLTLAAVSLVGCAGGKTPANTVQETGSKTTLVTATSSTLTRTASLVVTIQ